MMINQKLIKILFLCNFLYFFDLQSSSSVNDFSALKRSKIDEQCIIKKELNVSDVVRSCLSNQTDDFHEKITQDLKNAYKKSESLDSWVIYNILLKICEPIPSSNSRKDLLVLANNLLQKLPTIHHKN